MPVPTTDEQRRQVALLKDELEERGISLPHEMTPCGDLDACLLRLLKARQMDVSKTADLAASSVKWRAENKASEALTTFLDDETEAKLAESIPSGYIGFTKEGLPVKLEYTTKINVGEMFSKGLTADDFVFYHMREMEYLMQVQFQEAANRAGLDVVDQQTVIMDLSGLSMRQLTPTFFSVFRRISSMYQDNYPETMRQMFLVNIPSIFHMAWRMVSPALDERVKSKIFFLRNRDISVLQDFIDEKYLPVGLGGSNTGVDGVCVNSPNGYIPPVHRAMRKEINRRREQGISPGTSSTGSSSSASMFDKMIDQDEDKNTPEIVQKYSPRPLSRLSLSKSQGHINNMSVCASSSDDSDNPPLQNLSRSSSRKSQPAEDNSDGVLSVDYQSEDLYHSQLSVSVPLSTQIIPQRRWVPRLWRRPRDMTPPSTPTSSTTTSPKKLKIANSRQGWKRLMCLKAPHVKHSEPVDAGRTGSIGRMSRNRQKNLGRPYHSMRDMGIGSFDNLSRSSSPRDKYDNNSSNGHLPPCMTLQKGVPRSQSCVDLNAENGNNKGAEHGSYHGHHAPARPVSIMPKVLSDDDEENEPMHDNDAMAGSNWAHQLPTDPRASPSSMPSATTEKRSAFISLYVQAVFGAVLALFLGMIAFSR